MIEKPRAGHLVRALVGAAILWIAAAGAISAQVVDDQEELAWDRPEAWAMKYFASVSLLTGLESPQERRPGSLSIGLEIDGIPHLDEDQRRVGFGGVKVEDLNRMPVFFRPRLTIGLPAKLTLDLSWVPPVEVGGVKSNLLAAALERPFVTVGALTLGVRAYGQLGTVKGDLTCSDEDASHPPGDPGNIWGCEAPSTDYMTLNYVGLAFTGGYHFRSTEFHWGLAANHMDLEFQVDAYTFGFHDRSLLLAEGWTWSVNGGVSWPLGGPVGLSVEVFYSPLSVIRPPSTVAENDPLINLRTMLRIKL